MSVSGKYVVADRLMGVSGEILMFLFRRERVRRLKIGDASKGVGGTWGEVV